MDDFGIWGIIPPALTIILALVTKDVILSLFVGIFSGAMIVAGGNPALAMMNLTDTLASSLSDSWNIRIFMFCGLLGALVGMLAKTGAAWAFGQWASKRVKTKAGALLFTWFFGLIIFIDDYFNSLTIGTVMRPITDENKVSRAKLAYILDSTAAPVCIIAPISSWVVTVMSYIKSSKGFDQLEISEFAFFIQVIPYNIYALFAILMVVFIAVSGRDFGPMKKSEERAANGEGLFNKDRFGDAAGSISEDHNNSKAHFSDMLMPIGLLIILAVIFFPVTTWMGAVDGKTITSFSDAMSSIPLGKAFNDTDASVALMYAMVVTITITYIYYIGRKLLSIKTAANAMIDGFKSMVPALIILTLAWSIGSIIKSSPEDGGLGLANYLSHLVVDGGFQVYLLPVVVFMLSCLISFSTGTSWGTLAIMVPITMPISVALGQAAGFDGAELLNASLAPLGAVLGGAIFGDHASPISDTTILSSTGANCPHLEHVATQLPYAGFVAGVAIIGHITAGLTRQPYVSLIVSAAVFVAGLFFLTRNKKST